MDAHLNNNAIYDRTFGKLKTPWAMAGIAAFFISAPIVAIILDGQADHFGSLNLWRTILLTPAVILYILTVAPLLDRMGPEVITAFRQVVELDDESYARLVWESSRVSNRGELISILAGVLIGVWLTNSGTGFTGFSWSRLYWSLANAVLIGLLSWIVYISVSATRLTQTLHRQPLKIDLFDLTPFIPIGRQSLMLSLVFVGGILISLFLGVSAESLHAPSFWLTYSVMAAVPLVVFFLNMRPTHHVLAEEKKKRQARLEEQLRMAFTRLDSGFKSGQSPSPALDPKLAEELSALAIYERHLLSAPTWPYNTGQLRTLVFTVLIPLITLFGRLLVNRIFEVDL